MMRVIAWVLFLLLLPSVAEAHKDARRNYNTEAEPPPQSQYDTLASLRGTPGRLERENELADACGFPRITGDQMLQDLIDMGILVPVPRETEYYYVTAPKDLSYLLPEAFLYLESRAQKFFSKFHERLKITELARTPIHQRSLAMARRTIADGSTLGRRSTHLTGAAFDISRKPLAPREIKWLKKELAADKKSGLIEAVEERGRNTNNFHIMVCAKKPAQ